MKNFIRLTLPVIVCSIIFSACNKSNTLGKMIPKNALVIVHINEKSLSSKVSWNDVKQTTWFKEMHADSSSKAWVKNLMNDPSNSGIDASSDIIFFLAKDASSQNQIVVEGDVKDVKLFEEFNKHHDENSTPTKDGDINLMTLRNKVVVGWNDKKFAYVMSAPNTNKLQQFGTDSIPPAFRDSLNKSMAVDPLELSNTCKKLFSLSSDSNMSKNEKFTALLKEDGDIHIFQNTEAMMNSIPTMGMMGMLKLDVFFKDNVSTIAISFDNGKISFKQKLYTGKELSDVLKKHSTSNINTDMIKNIPSQNVAALFIAHFNPETIKDVIQLAGIDGFVNLALTQQGLTFDDVVKSIKGDILFSVSDLSVAHDSSVGMAPYKKPDMKFLFANTIGDKASFDKVFNAGKKMGKNFHTDSSTFNSTNDKYFVMGNSQDYISKYLSGNSNNKFDFTEKLAGHPVGGFVDLHKILTAVSSSISDSSSKVIMNESIKTWDNIYFMGGDFSDDAFTYTGEINFIDKNTNSLKQLNNYFGTIANVMIAKHKKDKTEADSYFKDSTIKFTPPLIIKDSAVTKHQRTK